MPPVRTIRSMVTLGVAIAVALVCVRLGIWQTRRLGERRQSPLHPPVDAQLRVLAVRAADPRRPGRQQLERLGHLELLDAPSTRIHGTVLRGPRAIRVRISR